MKRRRRTATSSAFRTDLRHVLGGTGLLALLGLGFGAAFALMDPDGPPEPGWSPRLTAAAGGATQAAQPDRAPLPVPRAEDPSLPRPQARMPHPPAPRAPDPASGAEPWRMAEGPAQGEVRPVPPGSGAAAGHAGPAPAAADARGGPAPLVVPQSDSAPTETALHRLAPDPVPAEPVGLFLTAGRDRAWRRVEDMLQAFSRSGYDLHRVRRGEGEVPRIFLASLPEDLPQIGPPEERKRTFIKAILPLILRANDEVLRERRRLVAIAARLREGGRASREERLWLEELAARYGTSPAALDELLLRVDMVPIALALAQAAEESGWGTSRFVQQGNAVFGQWTWDPGTGMVPRNRPRGRKHLVRAFPELRESVASYIRNLNSDPAYRGFRQARAAMRAAGQPLDSRRLAAHLTAYSERGPAYVASLHAIIDQNDLAAFDGARLADRAVRWTARLAGETLRSVF